MLFFRCVLPCGRSWLDSVQQSCCRRLQVLLLGRQVCSSVGAQSRYVLVEFRVVPVSTCCGGPYWTALPPGSVAVEGRTLSGSPRVSALLLAPHWAPCSIALPSLAGCSPGLPGTRVGRRRVKVRACRSSLQSGKRSACSRCRSFTVLEEQC